LGSGSCRLRHRERLLARQLRLPADTWIDLEDAADAIDEAEAWLRTLLVRALECLAEVSHANGEHGLAIQYTTEVLEVEPFRETAYQRLMRLRADGN
jgi:DNA-binding SARP family transcriptional activator